MDDWGDIELSGAAIESLGARRLADLLMRHAPRDAILREDLRLALLATGPVDRLAGNLSDAIQAIDADRCDRDGLESARLAATLDRLRASIVADLLPRAPQEAVGLLDRLLRLDCGVLERCDDSDGLIADIFSHTLADYGRAWLSLPPQPPQTLAELVFDLFAENDYSVRTDVVPAFKDALGPVGLDALEGLIRHRLGALSDNPGNWREAELVRALIEIADARGDLESFIALHELAGTEAGAISDICERLVAAGRLEEALDRTQRTEVPGWRRGDIDRLRIDILDRLGRTKEAQALRRDLFARSLSPTILDAYLAALPDLERAAALGDAIALARTHADVHGALDLLVRLDLDAAAALVGERVQDLNAQLYRVLRPAAERLAEKHPLAAVLLFRHLADFVLDQGQPTAYGYAVKDLEAAGRLSGHVTDWSGHPPADRHRQQLVAKHRQKRAFWERMRQAGLDWRH